MPIHALEKGGVCVNLEVDDHMKGDKWDSTLKLGGWGCMRGRMRWMNT